MLSEVLVIVWLMIGVDQENMEETGKEEENVQKNYIELGESVNIKEC